MAEIKIFYMTPNKRVRYLEGQINDDGLIQYNIKENHLIIAVHDENGMIMVTPTLAHDSGLVWEEELIINNPKFIDLIDCKSGFRHGGEKSIKTKGIFYNPLGSGGGNLPEEINTLESSINSYTSWTALTDIRFYANNLASSNVASRIRFYAKQNTGFQFWLQNPDLSYTDWGKYLANSGQLLNAGMVLNFIIAPLNAIGEYIYFANGDVKAFKVTGGTSNGSYVGLSSNQDYQAFPAGQSVNGNKYSVNGAVIETSLQNDVLNGSWSQWEIVQVPELLP